MAKQATPATGQMSDALQTREVEFQPLGEAQSVKLSIAQLKLAGIVRPTKKGHMPDDGTIYTFMQRCKAQGLNPFVGDAWLIGYDGNDGPEFSLITAVQSLYKRAELSGQYNGMESGVIVENNEGELVDLPGDFVPPGATLRGAWACCWRKDRDRPERDRINLEPFNKKRSLWVSNPQGQIVKCAEASVLRRAFPTTCGGLYTADEIPDSETTVMQVATKPKRISDTRPAPPTPAAPAAGPEPPSDGAIAEEELFRGLNADLSAAADYASAVTVAANYIDRNPPLEDKIHAALMALAKVRGWK